MRGGAFVCHAARDAGTAQRVVAVLDIDSTMLDDFSDEDAIALRELCMLLEPLFA